MAITNNIWGATCSSTDSLGGPLGLLWIVWGLSGEHLSLLLFVLVRTN